MLSVRQGIIGVLILLAIVVLMSGCGGSGMAAVLKVANAMAFIPDHWVEEGNVVKIVADVIGDGIREVRALIKKIGSDESTPIILRLNSSGKYEGTYEVSEPTPSSQPAEYTMVVTATDSTGNSDSSEPVSFEVPADK